MTVTLQGPTYFINDDGTSPTINNYGTFNANPQTGCPIDVEFAMNNTGTVLVSGSGTVMTLSGGGTSSGTFTVNSGATLGFTGGTHNLSGATFTNSGTINFDGATVTFNSPKTINGKVNFTQGTLNGSGTETFNGQFNWTGGMMSGNGTTVIQGSNNYFYGDLILDGRTLTNTSPYTYFSSFWPSMHIYGRNGAIFNNQTGTTVFLQGPTYFINDGGTAPTINNYGTFNANPSTGCQIDIEFAMNNTGTVSVSGTSTVMTLSGGGTSSGTFTVNSSTATLGFTGGTHNLSGATFNNSGTINFGGATVSFNSPKTIPGKINFNRGTLDGTGTLTFTGPFFWTGGTMSGNGTTLIQGSNNNFYGELILDGRTLTNAGQTTFSSGIESSSPSTHIYGRNGAIFNNQTGTSVTFLGPTYFINDGGTTPTINNSGTFIAILQPGTPIDVEFAMNNTGTVFVSGTGTVMTLSGGGTSSGSFTVNSGATLDFTGGTHNLIGATFSNSGTINFDGASVSFSSPTTIPGKVNFSQGTLSSTATLTFSGPFNWTGGEMNGSGTTVIQGSTNYFNGDLILDGRTLTNKGPTVFSPYFAPGFYSSTQLYGRNGAIFNNQATLTLQGSTNFINDGGTAPTINNSGAFYAAPQTGTVNIGFAMNNTGTVEAQKGTLILQGGVTQLAGNTLTGGTWNVRSNSTLDIANSGNITTNQGSVTLDGLGSLFTKINALADNQGNFSVINGRNFTTIADLANSGALTVGAGSEFTVTGNLTGMGTTVVDGLLTANSIVQNTLTIGSGATVAINPIPGGPLGDAAIQGVPEPGTLIMLLIAAAAVIWLKKKGARNHFYS